jgi:cytochrome P450
MTNDDYDHYSDEAAYNPWPRWAMFREGPPLAFSSKYDGFFIASRYQEICEILRNTAEFTSSLHTIPVLKAPVRPPIDIDPPDHQYYRETLNALFTPARVKEHEPWIRVLALDYVSRALSSKAFNFPRDIAIPLMRDITLTLLGCADRPPEVNNWADDLIWHRNAEVAGKNLTSFLSAEFAKRRLHPGDDVLTAIAQAKFKDRPLTDEERIGMALLVLLAGLDTTNFTMSGATLYFLQNPEAKKHLEGASEKAWNLATDEFVRWVSPAPHLARGARNDTEVRGCPIPKGDRVMCLLGSANRDPQEFANPEELVLDRFPNRHVGFGMGPHRCLGSHLAKLVIRNVMGELLKGLDDFELDPSAPVEWASSSVRGIRSLPLRRKSATASAGS